VKIHLVSEHASPLAVLGGVDAGGQNVHVAELARGLAMLGHDVVVHTRRDDPSLPRRVPFAPGVEVDHVTAGPAAPLPKDELLPHMGQFAADLARVWRSERPDVVHTHFWMSGLAGLRAASALGIPIAHTYHALGIEKRRNQGAADTSPTSRLDIERDLARRVDAVIATTQHEVRQLVEMGLPCERAHVVPCGVDLGMFTPRGRAWPPRNGLQRIVSVSRLVERKGIGNAITALAGVPDTELVIAGGPPGGLVDTDHEAQRFLALAERCGVADRVHVLGGLARDDVPALLRSADVVVCCPWYEPFGMVAVEAMACGRPVVATSVGGLAENVRHGDTGVLVPPRRPDAIARALRRLLADDECAAAMGARGRDRAQHYSWPMVAARTHEVLVSLARRAVEEPQRA
jgi:D-inositol-3-phosphate glycosyltransferase